MEGLRWLGHLVFSKNIAENWQAESGIATPCSKAEGVEVFDIFGCTVTEKESYDTVLRKPHTDETFERYFFRKPVQVDGEFFESFLRDLQRKAQGSNFGILQKFMIQDQIVFGTADDQLRERLLRENLLSLEDAIKAAQSAK
ncbi:hypothetical protein MRX96_030856 [Rhipicephalus microplus]